MGNQQFLGTYFSGKKHLVEKSFEEQGEIKVLGLSFQVINDTLCFDFSKFVDKLGEKCKLTKRIALGVVSSVYDPLGLVSPVVVELKCKLQELWKEALDWDDVMSPKMSKGFMDVFEVWKREKLVIPRQYTNVQGKYGIELHVLADASKKACGVLCYGRSFIGGVFKTYFIAAKTKVCGKKSENIPRMELVAALLGARLGKSVVGALGDVVQGCHFWTDSVVALSWIRSTSVQKSHFFQRRINEGRSFSDVAKWHFFPSEHNPADIPSRGMSISELKTSILWWHGPEFLAKQENEWPSDKAKEQLKVTASTVITKEEAKGGLLAVVNVQRYSSYEKLIGVVGRLLSVSEVCKKMRYRRKEWQAEKVVLMAVQKSKFV